MKPSRKTILIELECDNDVDDGWEMKFDSTTSSILIRYAKIPEPATLGLMLFGGFALWRYVRHRRLISDIAFDADYDQAQVEDVQEAAVRRFAAIFRNQCQEFQERGEDHCCHRNRSQSTFLSFFSWIRFWPIEY